MSFKIYTHKCEQQAYLPTAIIKQQQGAQLLIKSRLQYKILSKPDWPT